ncbi:hypothetical protein RFI_30144 [Reticulomyxa filosa]|uniref:Uncharacterized protein n=1 Tax=Reticulomyxa filosa TaxID=46433 RepID=X6M1E9_RETFI|nr:hypothetical protein RFI_30144 [Reticulomyxa filosa]|eukprot:ETO07247.1 hypothetical protein RFI_30144 [Reticulomyxa filosa]
MTANGNEISHEQTFYQNKKNGQFADDDAATTTSNSYRVHNKSQTSTGTNLEMLTPTSPQSFVGRSDNVSFKQSADPNQRKGSVVAARLTDMDAKPTCFVNVNAIGIVPNNNINNTAITDINTTNLLHNQLDHNLSSDDNGRSSILFHDDGVIPTAKRPNKRKVERTSDKTIIEQLI